jgi:GntR family transcriptional regulator
LVDGNEPELARRDPVPLYHQLKVLLTEKIESGEWAPGHQLPTEYELKSEFGVSRATIRQAMQLLEQQGLIERIQGRGTFVGRPKIAHNLMYLFSPIRGTTSVPLPSLDVVYLRKTRASLSVASHLGIDKEDQVFELKRRVVADNEPLLIIKNWMPTELFPGFENEFGDAGTVREVLLKQHGSKGVRQHKEIEITILDDEEAQDLATRPGSPALLVTYLTCDLDANPLEYREVLVRGDRCKYYVDQETPEFLV